MRKIFHQELCILDMEYMKDYDLCYNIEYVPFNSEEHFGAAGELAYRQDCKQKNIDFKLVINIDSPGHIGSKAVHLLR